MTIGDERVLVVAPLGRDGPIIERILAESGITSHLCRSLTELATCITDGAGLIILAEEAVAGPEVDAMNAALAAQPTWSELPMLMLLAAQDGSRRRNLHGLVSSTRTTVLQRPVPAVTLVTAARTLIAARRRQYEVRDLLERERTAREHAEAATRTKDEFLAMVSHELRTPLGAILLWSGLLARGRLEPAQATQAIETIRNSAQGQLRLIEDLLDLSRTTRGQVRLERSSHAMDGLVRAALDVMQPTADAKGVRLQAALDLHVVVLADGDRIQQIVWNLVSNAVKFTPAGGQVDVHLTATADHAWLRVADSGIGITADVLPWVFERFRQGDSSAGRRHAGLGVGLAITKELVELHGGSIHIESPGADGGVVVTVGLPLQSIPPPSAAG